MPITAYPINAISALGVQAWVVVQYTKRRREAPLPSNSIGATIWVHSEWRLYEPPLQYALSRRQALQIPPYSSWLPLADAVGQLTVPDLYSGSVVSIQSLMDGPLTSEREPIVYICIARPPISSRSLFAPQGKPRQSQCISGSRIP